MVDRFATKTPYLTLLSHMCTNIEEQDTLNSTLTHSHTQWKLGHRKPMKLTVCLFIYQPMVNAGSIPARFFNAINHIDNHFYSWFQHAILVRTVVPSYHTIIE